MSLEQDFIIKEKYKCAKSPIYFLNTYGHVFNASKKKITQMTCFKYQERCIKDFHKFQNNIVLKSRQCLPADTFIDTPNGPKEIQNFQVGDLVYSYNFETNKAEIDTVADAWCSGERQCVKFKLKDSRNIEVGENHPFWIVNKQEWVKAKDLEVNDEILDANIGFGNISVDEDEIKLLGNLITDGCTNKQVKFTNNSLDYLEEFETSVYNCFPELEIRKSPKLNGFDYFPHQKHGVNTLNPIMEWCETKGIANKKTEFKNLPEEVFSWDKKSVSLLINRIFAGDGWISILKKETNKRFELGIGSPSLVFLEQVKSLLKKYNIKGNIYEVKNMKLQQNKFFKLRITHSKSTAIFINEIGIYKKIKPEHLEIIKNRKHDVKNTSCVKKIEKTVIKNCFDISVTKNENFLINGLLVHNTGLSVVTAGYVAWRLMFRYEEKILIIANQGDGAIRFLDTVKQFIENTPEWLQPTSISKKNQTELEFAKPHGSWVKAKASSPEAGRGESLTMLVLDETAFIKDDEQIWMGAGMALSMTKGKCIMISTPNGTGGLYHETWVGAINGDNDFNNLEVHWTENPDSAQGLEIRKDIRGNDVPWSPWYESQCKRLGNDSVKIAQELDLSFEGSKYLVIENELIEKYEKKVRGTTPYLYVKYDFMYKGEAKAGNYTTDETNFHIFKQPEVGESYIVGVDVARGDGKDYSTIQVFNVKTLEQVAEYRERIGVDLLPYIVDWVGRTYNEAFIVIEANSFGLSVGFDMRDKFHYKKLFYSKNIQDMHVRSTSDYKIPEGIEIPGFQTSRKTRPLLIKSIIEHMREGNLILHSQRLLSEMKTFIMKGDRPEAEQGYNDDLIFALGLALYIRDTEYGNIALTNNMHKAMLESIIIGNNPSASVPTEDYFPGRRDEKDKKKDIDIPIGGGGLFIQNDNNSGVEDDDDFSWLLK
ncbi:hypothetical protein KBD45_03520 [Candidatus Dojkabacteria bacterium]|nr:hypothetical protein [Candidatus Dojkabacteria bacterium]